jgi:hypothetical protein
MTRYALNVHPDDRQLWMDMTGRDETRPYEMPPLHSVDYMVASTARNSIRLEWREISEEQS